VIVTTAAAGVLFVAARWARSLYIRRAAPATE